MKNLPRAILFGIPFVTVLYIFVNVSYLTVLSPLEIFQSSAVAMEWSRVVLGPAAFLMPIAVALSTLGALNGCMFTAGRQCYAAAREGHLPKVLSYVNFNNLTPLPALLFNTMLQQERDTYPKCCLT